MGTRVLQDKNEKPGSVEGAVGSSIGTQARVRARAAHLYVALDDAERVLGVLEPTGRVHDVDERREFHALVTNQDDVADPLLAAGFVDLLRFLGLFLQLLEE